MNQSGSSAECEQGAATCTIVVPCYNEEQRLPVAKFHEFLVRRPRIRFLFVNDGSSDQTLGLLNRMREEYPDCIEVLDLAVNAGKAEAVRSGMLRAIASQQADFVGFWDADLATPLAAIPKMLNKLIRSSQLAMVFGARVRLLGREIQRKPLRHYLGRVFATVASLMLRLPVYDTQCGAKIFRVTPDLSKMLKDPFQSRWIFDVELLARFLAAHRGDRQRAHDAIYEYPLKRWSDVAGSKVHPADFAKAFYELMRIRARYPL